MVLSQRMAMRRFTPGQLGGYAQPRLARQGFKLPEEELCHILGKEPRLL